MHYTPPKAFTDAMREASEKRFQLHQQLAKVREEATRGAREAIALRSQKSFELNKQLQAARDTMRQRTMGA